MTNAEKFREVFHVEPTKYSVPWSCDGVLCKNCSYYNGGCDASQWWNEEYKEPTTKNDLGVDAVSRQEVLYLIADNDLSMGQVVRGIHALPSVTPQEPRWIPVSEKLPEIHNYSEYYLVTLSNGEVTKVMFTETNDKSWWGWTQYKIVAWMPLPESYKLESER